MKGALPAMPDRAGGLRPEPHSLVRLSHSALIASADRIDCAYCYGKGCSAPKCEGRGWFYIPQRADG